MWLFFRCVEMVKSSQYVELANDLEINKAITYLRQKDFNQVKQLRGNAVCFRNLCACDLFGLWQLKAAVVGESQTSPTTFSILLVDHILQLNRPST